MIDDTALGEYQIVRPLGRGGMGLVFFGHDPVLDRPVAIKLIATAAPSTAARERFLIEARAIARLAHPNDVAVYRAGQTRDGRPFLVQELVRGHSLDRLTPPLAPAEVRRIGVEIARGLAAAHRKGVLHRDLKPANVMIADDGTVKLLDFGLAKLRPLDQRGVAIAEAPAPLADATPSTRDGRRRAPDVDAVAVTADINDDEDIVRRSGADGLHLSAARLADCTRRPEFGWLGASCHGAEELRRAAELGLDYALRGPVLPTPTHPEAGGLGWAEFSRRTADSPLPVFALGGMQKGMLPLAQDHGGHGIALMRGW